MNERSLANLERRAPAFKPGNQVAVKHGAQVSPQRLAPRAGELAVWLLELVPAGSAADVPTVNLLATILTRIELATSYLDERGLFDARGRPRPIVKLLSSWENSATRLLDALGMTPSARAKLGLDLVRARGEALRTHLDAHYAEGESA